MRFTVATLTIVVVFGRHYHVAFGGKRDVEYQRQRRPQ